MNVLEDYEAGMEWDEMMERHGMNRYELNQNLLGCGVEPITKKHIRIGQNITHLKFSKEQLAEIEKRNTAIDEKHKNDHFWNHHKKGKTILEIGKFDYFCAIADMPKEDKRAYGSWKHIIESVCQYTERYKDITVSVDFTLFSNYLAWYKAQPVDKNMPSLVCDKDGCRKWHYSTETSLLITKQLDAIFVNYEDNTRAFGLPEGMSVRPQDGGSISALVSDSRLKNDNDNIDYLGNEQSLVGGHASRIIKELHEWQVMNRIRIDKEVAAEHPTTGAYACIANHLKRKEKQHLATLDNADYTTMATKIYERYPTMLGVFVLDKNGDEEFRNPDDIDYWESQDLMEKGLTDMRDDGIRFDNEYSEGYYE